MFEEILDATKFDSTPLEWMWRVAQGGTHRQKRLGSPWTLITMSRQYGQRLEAQGEARIRLDSFLHAKLERYDVGRNDTDDGAASGLSPWIHFGHISSYEILHSILEKEG